MTGSIQEYANEVFFSFISVVAFLICVAGGMFGYKLWSTRRFCLKDFKRMSTEARALSLETTRIRRDVDQDDTAERVVKIANIEMLGAANEWDAGIRIALAAWDDIMHPDEDELDVETGKVDRLLRKRRKSHGRYVIGLMRTKCMEGIERRKELSPQMHRLHAEVMARKAELQSSRLDRRLANGREIKHETVTMVTPADHSRIPSYSHYSRLTHQSVSYVVPGRIIELVAPPRAASCPVLKDKTETGRRLGKVYSYGRGFA